MSRITNDDQNGNYNVEIFARKKRVNNFQTRTLEDAMEEAWRVYRHRSLNANTPTRRITVCRIWRPQSGRGWHVTDHQDITPIMRERWNKE